MYEMVVSLEGSRSRLRNEAGVERDSKSRDCIHERARTIKHSNREWTTKREHYLSLPRDEERTIRALVRRANSVPSHLWGLTSSETTIPYKEDFFEKKILFIITTFFPLFVIQHQQWKQSGFAQLLCCRPRGVSRALCRLRAYLRSSSGGQKTGKIVERQLLDSTMTILLRNNIFN